MKTTEMWAHVYDASKSYAHCLSNVNVDEDRGYCKNEAIVLGQWVFLSKIFLIIQPHIGDSVCLVPDHCSKVNIAIKQVTGMFCFPSPYKSYACTCPGWCAQR